jgi:RNA polymerase sigma-70 factor (ECF subfamily)
MENQSLCADDCLEDVVIKYSDMVYRQAFSYTRNKSDADDIFQEVFFRYIKNKPRFESEEHRKAWLIRVTVNCCKKIFVSAWKNKTVPLEDNIVFESDEENSLHFELMKLPMKYRTVIHLFYYENYSAEEIGRILKQNPSAVRMDLTRARRKLKEILKESAIPYEEEDYDVYEKISQHERTDKSVTGTCE